MKWCRIIESEGIQHCLRILPGEQFPIVEVSWGTEDGLYTVAIPGESFASGEALDEWFSRLGPADMDKMRAHYERAQSQPSASDIAQAAIERAKGGIH